MIYKKEIFTMLFALILCLSLSAQDEIQLLDDALASNDLLSYHTDAGVEIPEENETYENMVKARCFCRIGDNRGSRQKNYPNAIADLGVLKYWGGPIGGTTKREDECGNLCSKKAWQWYNKNKNMNFCAKIKRPGELRITAYSKVGGRDWTARGDYGRMKCCNQRTLKCPSGSHSEDKNFPGHCAVRLCDTNEGGARFYNKNGTAWGYIYRGGLYKLIPGQVQNNGWGTCR